MTELKADLSTGLNPGMLAVTSTEMVSFSALADFWCCPRLYHYRHEQGLPAPVRPSEDSREGSWIHAQLHLHTLGQTPPMAADPAYAQLWQAYLEAISPYADRDSRSEWACHVPLRIAGETFWLHGRLDRLYLDGETVVLLDFKTGQSGPGPLEELQLDFYAWLLWQCRHLLGSEPITRIESQAIWLRQPGQTLERSLSAEGVNALTTEFTALLEAMTGTGAHDVPEPRSVAGKPWCNMCEYQRLCPEGSFYA